MLCQVNKTHLLGTRCAENNDAHLSAFKNDRTKLGRKLNFSVDKTWRYLWVALKLLEAAVAGANERNKKEEDKVRKMKGKSLRTSWTNLLQKIIQCYSCIYRGYVRESTPHKENPEINCMIYLMSICERRILNKPYKNCGNETKWRMILAAVNTIYAIALVSLKTIQDFNGIWTRDFAMPMWCCNQLSYEATDVGSWSIMCSYVPVKEMNLKDVYEINHIGTAEIKTNEEWSSHAVVNVIYAIA